MRELTFAGFLKNYVRELSHSSSHGLYALAEEAALDNPRLKEPLLLYALFSSRKDLLLKATHDKSLHSDYSEILSRYDQQKILSALESDSPLLPDPYKKVWHSYLSRKNRWKTDDKTKALMRQRILELQKELNVTNYRLYTDLHLNPGNMNAWLKHGISDKVSLDNARRTWQYLQMLQQA